MRVSGTDQVLDLQRDALAAIRCDRVWEEVTSGAKDDRPALLDLLSHLRAGGTLVVWRLDRLGRSLKHLIETVEDLQRRATLYRHCQVDGWRTALLNAECQKTTARSAKA
ncbi:recombinase family protein [Rhodococcus globerulus]|uniref:recombinase family protein n=1 Tax=Rhodococcus globerulus TaxID=33008 RepID=UPI00311A9B82